MKKEEEQLRTYARTGFTQLDSEGVSEQWFASSAIKLRMRLVDCLDYESDVTILGRATFVLHLNFVPTSQEQPTLQRPQRTIPGEVAAVQDAGVQRPDEPLRHLGAHARRGGLLAQGLDAGQQGRGRRRPSAARVGVCEDIDGI